MPHSYKPTTSHIFITSNVYYTTVNKNKYTLVTTY